MALYPASGRERAMKVDRPTGQLSPERVPWAVVEQVLSLARRNQEPGEEDQMEDAVADQGDSDDGR